MLSLQNSNIFCPFPVLPRIVPFSFEDGPASSGQDISITCTVPEGDLPIDISWFLNDKSINEYSGITTVKAGKRNQVLNIETVAAEHSGNFTCVANNKAGSVRYTADLFVNGTLIKFIQKFSYYIFQSYMS